MTDETMQEIVGAVPDGNTEEAASRWAKNKALAIALDGVNEAIVHRFNVLCVERKLLMADLAGGDWMQEFIETDPTMATLHEVRNILYNARLEV